MSSPETVGQVRMWESLRADARHQDSEVEKIITELEAVVQQIVDGDDNSSSPLKPQFIQRFERAKEDVERGILKMQSIVSSMSDILRGLASSGIEDYSTMYKHTQRFEDFVSEKNQIVRHLSREFLKRKEKSELLRKVHTTIEIHKDSEEMKHLSGERESLQYSRKKVNELLANTSINKRRLVEQRQRFLAVTDKLVILLERVPFISNVLKKIDAKRRRDVIILGIVIAVCILLTFLFM
eukprot:Tbor_TRINITY_DN3975_c0_g1::TRINITY_DN3975_c0_g1_i1::g.721::m.721/K08495/GOSR1, GOS1; golgi SNAP receptor complex member 1